MKFALLLLIAALACSVIADTIYNCVPYDPTTRTSTCQGGASPGPYAPPTGGKYRAASACHITNLPSTLQSSLRTLFPEGSHPDPALLRKDVFAVFTQDNSNMSFTYVSTGAGYTNRMGYAVYDDSTHTVTGAELVFPKVNTNSGYGCLSAGDTYKFGPFNTGQIMIFFLDPDSGSTRYWSFIDGTVSPPFRNPDTGTCSPDGCIHGSWAYLTQEEITVFGFEDLSLGDADYNDMMFFLQIEGGGVFNEVPEYGGGTILICNADTTISPTSPSYAEVNCTQWALLESTSATQSCLTYMSIPDGWIWAPYTDPRVLQVVSTLNSQWSYTNAVCFLFSKNETSGAGYHPDGSPCSESEYTISTFKNGTKTCYNAKCTSRFVLRGLDLGVTCSSTSRCSATTNGAILGFAPSTSAGVTLFPSQYSVYLKASTGSVAVSTSLQLPGPSTTTNQLIDVMVLADFSTVPSGKVAGVISSWSSFAGTFTAQKLNATIGFAQYTPSNTSPYYSVTSTYTLSASPAALTSSQFPSTAASCPASNRKMLAAMKDVMNNPAINWRKDTAFKILLVATNCDFDYTTDIRAAGIETGIVPVFLYPNRDSFPSTWTNAPTAYTVPLQGMYKTANSGNNDKLWDSPFSSSTSNPIRGAGYLKDYPPQLFGVAASGSTSFVSNLPTSYVWSGTNGFGTLNYTIAWPNSVAYDNSVSSYSTVVRVMGRETTSFTINFNHKPVLNDLSYSFVGNVNQTITFTPSDADGNTLNIVITRLPTKGRLFLSDGVTPIQKDISLNGGVYSFLYVPNSRVSGQDYFLATASDGCATDDANVTLSISYANTPPVALDFIVYMDEDSAPTGSNGLVDFSTRISDADITAGQPQTLVVQLVSMPNPSTNGALTSVTSGAAVTVGAISGYSLRFNLTKPRSGFGNVTFNYQVTDGTSQGNSASNIATVTIVIRHVNHAPILAINPTSFVTKEGDPAVSISGSITDYDNDNVNLYAIAHNVSSYEFTGFATANKVLTSSTSVSPPFAFYNVNRTVTNNIYTLAGLSWSGTTGNGYQQVTFAAQDSLGAWSNSVDVMFRTLALAPPRWTDRPINGSAGPFQIMQNTPLTGLRFAATDDDSGEYASLLFRLAVAPANGVVKIKPISSGSDLAVSTANSYSNANGNSAWIGTAGSAVPPVSYFFLEYIPNPTFYGTDTFTFNVRDIGGLFATEVATVTVDVARQDTPPISADSSLYAPENTLASTQIPASSTNIATNNVFLQLVSVNFPGQLFLDAGDTVWIVGANTSAVNSGVNNGLLTIYAKSNFGAYSDAGVPTGTFTYKAYEPASGLFSGVYTGSIFVSHVNHAPTSRNQNDEVKRRVPLAVQLYAYDSDIDDTPATNVKAYFQSIAVTSKGKFYFDQAMTNELTSDSFSTALTDRTFYYLSEDAYSQPQNSPLASYTFYVVDSHGLSSSTYRGSIVVLYAGDVPAFGGSLEATTYQETPVPMVLGVGVVTESGADPVVTITSLPTRGTFAACKNDGTCGEVPSVPFVVQSTTGRVIFVPRDYDWDNNFTTFNFNLTDPLSGATGAFTMTIHVIHVNKRPNIAAANFLTTAESSQVIVVNESSSRNFDWRVWDVDSLPSVLTTSLRVAFYTSQGFELYSCTANSGWNNTACTFNPGVDVPLALRADFTRNGKKSISSFETVTTACPDFTTLKTARGLVSRNCESHFKFSFVPASGASFTPYVSITFTAIDDYSAESTSISALIAVKAINNPPTIWAPDVVLAGQGVSNPFIRDTSSDSSTYNNPVSVADVDSNGNIELLTITVVDGYSGNLVWPESAPCSADSSVSMQWNCLDRIASFNQWLNDLRFEVTSGERADVRFTINDLGFSSDYKPSTNLTATAVTSVRLTAAVAAPKGNSSTLAIAVGVAAGVGLLLLGALGFFLRKAVAPPADDYFSAATTPLSAAPQSPLYQAQNTEHVNALYKGK